MVKAKEWGTGKPYVRVSLTPELEEMLDRWKELNGSSYANTIRIALRDYLGPRLENVPKKRTETDPEKRLAAARNELTSHYRDILQKSMDSDGKDFEKVLDALQQSIEDNEESFSMVGYEPSRRTVCALIIRDERSSKALREYARKVYSKIKYAEKGEIDLDGKPCPYDSNGKAIHNKFLDNFKLNWK